MTSRIIGYDISPIGGNGEQFLIKLLFDGNKWVQAEVSRNLLYELRATINGELEFHPMHLDDKPTKYPHAWKESDDA